MNGFVLACLAALLLVVTVLLLMRMIRTVELEGRVWILSTIVTGAAGLAIFTLARDPGFASGIIAGAALLLSLLWGVLRILAPQSKQVPAVAVGESLPEFTAPDQNGEAFEFASLRGRPTLLKFFRGHW